MLADIKSCAVIGLDDNDNAEFALAPKLSEVDLNDRSVSLAGRNGGLTKPDSVAWGEGVNEMPL